MGSAFELKIRRELAGKGYTIYKATSGHYGWLAKKEDKTYFVECKCAIARLSQSQERFLLNI